MKSKLLGLALKTLLHLAPDDPSSLIYPKPFLSQQPSTSLGFCVFTDTVPSADIFPLPLPKLENSHSSFKT